MWVDLSRDELEIFRNKRKRERLVAIGLAFIFASLIAFIILVWAIPTRNNPMPEARLPEMYEVLRWLLLWAGVIVVYVFWPIKSHYRCNMCDKQRFRVIDSICNCGGRYIDVSVMRWVEENKNPSTASIKHIEPPSLPPKVSP